MDFSFDVVAALSALGGAFVGAIITAVKWGRHEGVVELKIDNLSDKMTLVCDELARRLTNVENRVQYDGYYTNPRARRDPAE
jgi:hypothetical protein